MSEYQKKLHIRKNSIITDINLYTTSSEVGTPSLSLKDGSNTVYAKLGDITDANASELRVRNGSDIYAVLKTAAVAASIEYESRSTPGGILKVGLKSSTPFNLKQVSFNIVKFTINPGVFNEPTISYLYSSYSNDDGATWTQTAYVRFNEVYTNASYSNSNTTIMAKWWRAEIYQSSGGPPRSMYMPNIISYTV